MSQWSSRYHNLFCPIGWLAPCRRPITAKHHHETPQVSDFISSTRVCIGAVISITVCLTSATSLDAYIWVIHQAPASPCKTPRATASLRSNCWASSLFQIDHNFITCSGEHCHILSSCLSLVLCSEECVRAQHGSAARSPHPTLCLLRLTFFPVQRFDDELKQPSTSFCHAKTLSLVQRLDTQRPKFSPQYWI